ncbi:MAG: c-type cytochrome, partial [Planctomycetota bacterium]
TSNESESLREVIRGMKLALRGVRRVGKPLAFDAFASAAKRLGMSDDIRALEVVFGDGQALESIKAIAADGSVDPNARLSAIETLIQNRPDDLFDLCRGWLRDPKTNVLAAQGLVTFENPDVASMILDNYSRFRAPQRSGILSLLVTRVSFAEEVLSRIGSGKLPKADLSAYHARQIHSLGSDELTAKLSEVWGEIRTTTAEKRAQIGALKAKMSPDVLSAASLPSGRAVFEKSCSNCHRMYGQGGEVGPDLTGANRSNMDYLLDNIVDPSAVVDKDFRMSVILLEDGRVLNGLVLDRNDQTWTIQTATDKIIVVADEIEESRVTEKSPMPDGMLDALSEDQQRDLLAYLRHPTQVPMPSGDAETANE